MWDNSGVFMGNGYEYDPSYMGESLRGMQQAHLGNIELGAGQQALANLRTRLSGPLAAQAQAHFNRFAPLQRPVRPAYKDSTQIGIKCQGTLTPSAWDSTSLPTVTGSVRFYESFKTEKAIVAESVKLTFNNDSLGTKVRSFSVSDGADIVLTQAFAGAKNCFPTAPDEDSGIAGPAISMGALGNGLSWPTVNGGIDIKVTFAIEDSVLYKIDPPTGYTPDDITSVVVKVRLTLFGPSLRP